MARQQQVPVSQAALIGRISRALRKQDEKLKKTRGARALQQLGEYYTVRLSGNYPTDTDVDPEKLGRDLGVLNPWERVVS
jgi:hypothetical protein